MGVAQDWREQTMRRTTRSIGATLAILAAIGAAVAIVVVMATSTASQHPGGVNSSMGDGSVRFVAQGIAQQTWRALGSPSGGEVVGDSF
jgi:prepilin-type processing-associated H-X9-DG protein